MGYGKTNAGGGGGRPNDVQKVKAYTGNYQLQVFKNDLISVQADRTGAGTAANPYIYSMRGANAPYSFSTLQQEDTIPYSGVIRAKYWNKEIERGLLVRCNSGVANIAITMYSLEEKDPKYGVPIRFLRSTALLPYGNQSNRDCARLICLNEEQTKFVYFGTGYNSSYYFFYATFKVDWQAEKITVLQNSNLIYGISDADVYRLNKTNKFIVMVDNKTTRQQQISNSSSTTLSYEILTLDEVTGKIARGTVKKLYENATNLDTWKFLHTSPYSNRYQEEYFSLYRPKPAINSGEFLLEDYELNVDTAELVKLREHSINYANTSYTGWLNGAVFGHVDDYACIMLTASPSSGANQWFFVAMSPGGNFRSFGTSTGVSWFKEAYMKGIEEEEPFHVFINGVDAYDNTGKLFRYTWNPISNPNQISKETMTPLGFVSQEAAKGINNAQFGGIIQEEEDYIIIVMPGTTTDYSAYIYTKRKGLYINTKNLIQAYGNYSSFGLQLSSASTVEKGESYVSKDLDTTIKY